MHICFCHFINLTCVTNVYLFLSTTGTNQGESSQQYTIRLICYMFGLSMHMISQELWIHTAKVWGKQGCFDVSTLYFWTIKLFLKKLCIKKVCINWNWIILIKKKYLLNSMSADQEADNNRYVHQDLIVKTFARTRISICHWV